MKKNLNTTVIYILTILGLLCCCFGGLGILFSGPAFYMANKKIKDAELHPEAYEGNLKAMKTAKTFALVVTIICGVFLLMNLYDLATGGWEQRQDLIDQFMESYKEALESA
ncbi:CCC motif membrane protein [Gaetbulibacter saemankumensis]|uniref:CCC motif membrane protein n=1 Tax=Gaetbulibacter saemankumensis TaxID=311208 RepID=UPI0005505F26|nr:CCC motif membrane protein [Gaetbulibacter saemankumensis]